jgi:hypothetical protein
MALRAVKPEVKEVKRAKILVSGEPGCGKSFFSIQFPNVYYIDIEKGARREQYQEMLIKSGGVYVGPDQGVSTFQDVNLEVKSLATEKHNYSSVVLDSLSHAYFMEAARIEAKEGSEFGRDKKGANKPSRELLRWIELMDMNVILIAHQKIDWSNKDNVKTSYDAYEKTGYALDLWLEIVGKNFIVRKTRLKAFPEGLVFPREYAAFATLFGPDKLGAVAHPVELASKEQVDKFIELTTDLGIPDEKIQKILEKYDVEKIEELTSTQIADGIKFYSSKLKELTEKVGSSAAPATSSKKGK